MEDSWELFNEEHLSRLIGGKRTAAQNKVKGKDGDFILGVNKPDFIDKVVHEVQIESVSIHFSKRQFNIEKEHGDRTYQIYYPVSGNNDLLKYQPNEFNGWSTDAFLTEEGDELWVEFSLSENPPEHDIIEERIEEIEANIEENYDSLISEVEEFNETLPLIVEEVFDESKRNHLGDISIEEELDIPVREKEERPDTVAIEPPEQRDEISVEEPEFHASEPPEVVPTVPEEAYYKILNAINDIGKGFEQSPYLFHDEEEEALRDYIRVFLEMNFEGSATGETFNNQGKTDILLRHDGGNVFIAECAWWDGKEHFKGKIGQLNDYLTWRDTKAAVILFTDNVEITHVHEQISEGAEEHPQYRDLVSREDASWFQYRFTFPEDESRELDLAVMIFHLRHSEDSE